MPVASFSTILLEWCLDLAWSLWAELGVSGWQRRHSSFAINPEPLILYTAGLGDADPRLRDEATDWCVQYGRYVSAVRLRNLLASASQETHTAFGTLAATVNAHARLNWPAATTPRPYRPTRRSMVTDFCRPALVVLRLRAMFEVGARGELVGVLLSRPSAWLSASDLAPEAGYTKRNVAEALDSLRMAGVLDVRYIRNTMRFRLAQPEHWQAAIGEIPEYFPRWAPLLRALWEVVNYERRLPGLEPIVAAVEAHRTRRQIVPDLQLAGIAVPPEAAGEDAQLEFERWALHFVTRCAAGDATFLAAEDADARWKATSGPERTGDSRREVRP